METHTQKFEHLQNELTAIEKDINFVETTDVQKEKISQKLDNIMRRIDEFTTNQAEKLKAKEVIQLTQQVERIALAVGIKTTVALDLLKQGITTEYVRSPSVLEGIEESTARAQTKIEEMQTRPII